MDEMALEEEDPVAKPLPRATPRSLPAMRRPRPSPTPRPTPRPTPYFGNRNTPPTRASPSTRDSPTTQATDSPNAVASVTTNGGSASAIAVANGQSNGAVQSSKMLANSETKAAPMTIWPFTDASGEWCLPAVLQSATASSSFANLDLQPPNAQPTTVGQLPPCPAATGNVDLPQIAVG